MRTLSTLEAAAITGLDERTVRKEVEHGIIEAGSPPRFAEVALVYLRALAAFTFHLGAEDRRQLYARIADALDRRAPILELGPGWYLDVAAISSDLERRLDEFERWRGELVTRQDILGGETVFPGTRLSVRQVGELRDRGVSVEEILEDYPSLSAREVELAGLFVAAYPRIGRPRGQAAAR